MMIQVVYCHPLTDSFNHAIFQATVDELRANGHEVIATDLYREQFDPVMSETERRSYYCPPYDTSAVSKYTETLKSIDGIIFCFPHWWLSMPAMLKGYFDRVWAPGVAFDAQDGRVTPLLNHVRLFGVITSYGQSSKIIKDSFGDPGRKVLFHTLHPLCAEDSKSFYFALYDMDTSSQTQRERFLKRVRRAIGSIR